MKWSGLFLAFSSSVISLIGIPSDIESKTLKGLKSVLDDGWVMCTQNTFYRLRSKELIGINKKTTR